MMNEEFFKKLSELHPYITVCSYNGQEYVGIIQNRDEYVTSLYDYGAIAETELKIKFLELGDIWWGESNRCVPINIFLREDWDIFKKYIKTFNNKGLKILHGPVVSLSNLSKKRIKRKSITLVKRL